MCHTIQYNSNNTIQYNTIQHNEIQYNSNSTTQYNTIQYNNKYNIIQQNVAKISYYK